ncbi:hypothetical protein ILYODFUR_029270 [Ilyodon furcidens]|uniref:Uncharacterized protein n=1 Tax=Ilyodon furcidens TaxID=33524 RepID=A0ABV0UM96_9TELE
MTSLDPVEEFMSVCQQRDISALVSPPIPMITGVEEVGPLERSRYQYSRRATSRRTQEVVPFLPGWRQADRPSTSPD